MTGFEDSQASPPCPGTSVQHWWNDTEENWNTQSKTYPSVTLPTTDPTLTLIRIPLNTKCFLKGQNKPQVNYLPIQISGERREYFWKKYYHEE